MEALPDHQQPYHRKSFRCFRWIKSKTATDPLVIFLFVFTVLVSCNTASANSIRIGEISSYGPYAVFTNSYRNGWHMALDEINSRGGVMGRPLEVISRDDQGSRIEALRHAEELIKQHDVIALFGGFSSQIATTLADYAQRSRSLFIATLPITDALTLNRGNRYVFRLRPSIYMHTAMLVDAVKNSGVRRWAIVAPNYEYGLTAAASFKRLIEQNIGGTQIVSEQYPTLGKIDAKTVSEEIKNSGAQGIFCALYGADLNAFSKAGDKQGLFHGVTVLNPLGGEPEFRRLLVDPGPDGWLVTGFPSGQVKGRALSRFIHAYQARHGDAPQYGALVGYTALHIIAEAINRAATTNRERLIVTLEDMEIDSLFGRISIRGIDHQATIGAWVGRLAVTEDNTRMVDWRYADGAQFMIPEPIVEQHRRAD